MLCNYYGMSLFLSDFIRFMIINILKCVSHMNLNRNEVLSKYGKKNTCRYMC